MKILPSKILACVINAISDWSGSVILRACACLFLHMVHLKPRCSYLYK